MTWTHSCFQFEWFSVGSGRFYMEVNGGACGVMVIVVGNGHGDKSSNPGRDWLYFT